MPLPALVGIVAALIPSVIDFFTDDDDKIQAAEKVADIATKITGATDRVDAIQQVSRDPELLVKLQQESAALIREMIAADSQSFAEAHKSYRESGGKLVEFVVKIVMFTSLPVVLILLVSWSCVLYFAELDTATVGILGPIVGSVIQAVMNDRVKVMEFLMGTSLAKESSQAVKDSMDLSKLRRK